MNRPILKTNLWMLLPALVAVAVVTACQSLGGASSTPTPPPDIDDILEVWDDLSESTSSTEESVIIVEIWNILSQRFVEKDEIDTAALSAAAIEEMMDAIAASQDGLDSIALRDAAIEGMIRALEDPYTAYLDPEEYHMTLGDIEGRFEGIGASVHFAGGEITVITPLAGSPAGRDGMLPGDVILEVDGASVSGWSLWETIGKIRGPKGTVVRILVQHEGASGPSLLEITRDVIELDSVTWQMLPDEIAHVEIEGFDKDTAEELVVALEEIADQEGRGIVLDLRNNPGGLLSTTVAVASQFLDDGLVLYEIDGDGVRTDFEVKSGGLAPDIPLVVLINGHSASGSEVLAGALQDHERAALIGTTTFGKGSVNIPQPLSNGAGLYYTVGRWYSPDGRLIEGIGLEPDIRVENIYGSPDDPQLDSQLERALEYLADQLIAASG